MLRVRLARLERAIRQEGESLHLLRENLGRLQEGPPGTSVPRVECGGDEFAILFPETPAEAARGAVEKLRTRIHSLIQEQGWPVSCSLGVITFESAPESVDVMLSRADSLMYEAKGAGKSTVRQAQVP